MLAARSPRGVSRSRHATRAATELSARQHLEPAIAPLLRGVSMPRHSYPVHAAVLLLWPLLTAASPASAQPVEHTERHDFTVNVNRNKTKDN